MSRTKHDRKTHAQRRDGWCCIPEKNEWEAQVLKSNQKRKEPLDDEDPWLDEPLTEDELKLMQAEVDPDDLVKF